MRRTREDHEGTRKKKEEQGRSKGGQKRNIEEQWRNKGGTG